MSDKKLENKIPVVVVLGHVDAGKSSILDFIRKTKIVEKESGGITQHVGVYDSEINGQKVTFVDTPGHAAFSSIRSRGAKIADLAILVVAADQGIQPQTKEAIAYLKSTNLPTIVAINKADLGLENINTIKGQLNKEGITVESMGGSVPALEISAKTGQGVQELIEMILLMFEMEEIKSDKDSVAEGIIVESHQDSFRGPVATVIVEKGVLAASDILGTPSASGKTKGLFDSQGIKIKEAIPGQAAIVLGFSDVPKAGESFKAYKSLAEAEAGAEDQSSSRTIVAEDGQAFNIIIKADVHSSLEAIQAIIKELPREKVVANIIEAKTGNVTQNDVNLAQTSQAEIIGFNVDFAQGVRNLADKAKVVFKNFDIIYKLTDYVGEGLEKRRKPEEVRREVGKLEILAIFKTEKNRQIIGGNVVSGQIEKGAKLDVYRGKEKIGQGKIMTLESRKKKADLVPKGQQAGILYEGSGRLEEGDLVEAYFIDLI
jgi:translation initiation factor IF-2